MDELSRIQRGALGLAIGLATLLSGACRTIKIRRPSISAAGEVRVAEPKRAWEVWRGDEAIGLAVFFESQNAPEDSLYMVRNVWHQDLGLIDAFGRAYRYLPHHREPAWVASGTVLQGVEGILDTASCRLVEVPFLDSIPRRKPSPGEIEQQRIDVNFPRITSPPAPVGTDSTPKGTSL